MFFDPYLLSFVCYSALLFLFLHRNKTEILHSNSLWLTNLKICSLKLLMMFVRKCVKMGIYLCLRFILFFLHFANSFGKSCILDAHDWKICYFSNRTNISLCSNLSLTWQQCFCCCNISRMHLLCNTGCLVCKLKKVKGCIRETEHKSCKLFWKIVSKQLEYVLKHILAFLFIIFKWNTLSSQCNAIHYESTRY